MVGFLGSKVPNPPAIATAFARCTVPLLVTTSKVPSSSFVKVCAVSPKVNPG